MFAGASAKKHVGKNGEGIFTLNDKINKSRVAFIGSKNTFIFIYIYNFSKH